MDRALFRSGTDRIDAVVSLKRAIFRELRLRVVPLRANACPEPRLWLRRPDWSRVPRCWPRNHGLASASSPSKPIHKA